MEKIAIIGTGIAGMGCGHFLYKKYDVTLFEQNDYIGGHTHTVYVDDDGTPIPVDTGFIVYNEVTYPNLTRLFKELKVPTKPTSMSFSVQHLPSGLEFCGSGLSGLFAQRQNIFRPSFLRMLTRINRFNKECLEVLDNEQYAAYTLADYIREKNYGDDMLFKYLIPMSSAVWSTPPDAMLQFPVRTLVRFFYNHGFLGLHTQHPWRTVANGSQTYRDILIAPFREKIHTRRAAQKVVRENGGVTVIDATGALSRFDKAILAGHADDSLKLLENPTDLERSLLSAFQYQKNHITLHTDASVMPKTRRAWSSWNYRIGINKDGRLVPSTVYWMNSLQQVSEKNNYFVSINDPGDADPKRVLLETDYDHPLFTVAAMKAQKRLPELNAGGPVYFAGSYFRYGFHEDAFTAAIDAVTALTGEPPW